MDPLFFQSQSRHVYKYRQVQALIQKKKKKKKTQQLQTLVHVLNTFDAMVLAIYFMKIRHFTLFYDPLNMAILSP